TSAFGSFFSKLTKGKLDYKLLVTISCVIAGLLSVTGVDNIIQFAYPPLAFVYPIVMTLVSYIVIFGAFVKSKLPYVWAMIASTIIATFNILKIFDLLQADTLATLNHIPLFSYELGCVVPSLVLFTIGVLADKLTIKKGRGLNGRVDASAFFFLLLVGLPYRTTCFYRGRWVHKVESPVRIFCHQNHTLRANAFDRTGFKIYEDRYLLTNDILRIKEFRNTRYHRPLIDSRIDCQL